MKANIEKLPWLGKGGKSERSEASGSHVFPAGIGTSPIGYTDHFGQF